MTDYEAGTFFPIFLNFFEFSRRSLGMGLALSKNGCTIPFFEPCPYTWKGEIFHSSWSLEISFFSKMFLLILEYIRAFISTIGIFVS
jgi:hypothetical protein